MRLRCTPPGRPGAWLLFITALLQSSCGKEYARERDVGIVPGGDGVLEVLGVKFLALRKFWIGGAPYLSTLFTPGVRGIAWK